MDNLISKCTSKVGTVLKSHNKYVLIQIGVKISSSICEARARTLERCVVQFKRRHRTTIDDNTATKMMTMTIYREYYGGGGGSNIHYRLYVSIRNRYRLII